jgi:hypothetical protein
MLVEIRLRVQIEMRPKHGLAREPAYVDLPVLPSGPIPGVVLDASECEPVDQRGELIDVGSVVTIARLT